MILERKLFDALKELSKFINEKTYQLKPDIDEKKYTAAYAKVVCELIGFNPEYAHYPENESCRNFSNIAKLLKEA